jgi:type I restriction enzyme S subunit
MNNNDEFYDLNQTPKNWKKTKIKYILDFKNQKTNYWKNEQILSLTKNGIIIRDMSTNQGQVAETYEDYNLLEINDICMNPMDLLSGWVDLSKYKGLISPAYFILKCKNENEVNTNFLKFFLQSNYLKKSFFKRGKGVASHENMGRWVLTPEEFGKTKFYYPSDVSYQKKISEFLKRKEIEYYKLKNLIQKKIKLLQELKICLIDNTVYRGLNYKIKKKSFNIYFGLIPEHWKISKIKKFSSERNIKVNDKIFPPLSVSKKGIVDQLADVSVSKDGENRKLVKKGDFVINSRSDRKGSSGFSCRDGSVSLINIVFEIKNIFPDYLNYIFKSHSFVEEYFRLGKGIHWDLWTTKWEKLKNIYIPIPPIIEQKEISSILNSKIKNIDDLIERYKKKNKLYFERYSTLIFITVSGKKDLDYN